MHPLNDQEFARFQRFLSTNTGIALANSKRTLVAGRLEKRVRALSLGGYAEYLKRILDPAHAGEAQVAIDLLTTNETYFFREPKHFDLLRQHAQKTGPARGEFRVWSAACSTGEEPYSIAMVLAECFQNGKVNWRVHATDISTRVLTRARKGHYSLARTEHMPPAYLRRYCLKGVGKQDGTLLVDKPIRERVTFEHVNLNEKLPSLPQFDVIFLRNVMIYFSNDTKSAICARLAPHLRDDGLFFVGHSETLNGITTHLKSIAPAVYVHA